MVKEFEVLLKLYQGYGTVRTLAKSLDISSSQAHRLLKSLRLHGLVERQGAKGFRLTERGRALVEREAFEAPITPERFIVQIQMLTEQIAKAESPEKARNLRLLGLRYVLDGTWLFIGELIWKIAEELEVEKMKRLLDEAYASTLKELIAWASNFCILLDKTGWSIFHNEMVNLILRIEGCGLGLNVLNRANHPP
jgi:DNA-binding MarR family transcriptional regulator